MKTTGNASMGELSTTFIETDAGWARKAVRARSHQSYDGRLIVIFSRNAQSPQKHLICHSSERQNLRRKRIDVQTLNRDHRLDGRCRTSVCVIDMLYLLRHQHLLLRSDEVCLVGRLVSYHFCCPRYFMASCRGTIPHCSMNR